MVKGQAQRAYEEVRGLILRGAYNPGQRLHEEELAAAVGVSRTPIREALRQLHSEGLVRVVPHRGTRVTDLTPSEVLGSYEVRAVLESAAARLAATRLTDTDLAQLRRCQDEMESVVRTGSPREIDQVAELNRAFHRVILTAAGNPELANSLGAVIVPPLHRRFWHDPVARRRSFFYHREMIAAFEAGDEQWAEAVTKAHLLAARVSLSHAARPLSHESLISDASDLAAPG